MARPAPTARSTPLAGRLANVRTLAYAANRPDWLRDPRHWQEKTRDLEDRISDALHEKLMQRFIDRRTSALMRGLNLQEELLAGVGGDGAVTVEGQFVGSLRGVTFEPVRGASALEDKALRAAAQRAVSPEIARRLGKLAAEPDEAFAVQPYGRVLWQGDVAAVVDNDRPFAPRVRLLGELGPAQARERAARRLEAFLAAEASRRLKPLKRLEAAIAEGRIKGLARGVAYRLAEAGGVVPRDQGGGRRQGAEPGRAARPEEPGRALRAPSRCSCRDCWKPAHRDFLAAFCGEPRGLEAADQPDQPPARAAADAQGAGLTAACGR